MGVFQDKSMFQMHVACLILIFSQIIVYAHLEIPNNHELNKSNIQSTLVDEAQTTPTKKEITSIKKGISTEEGWMKVNKKRKNTPILPRKTRSQDIQTQKTIGGKIPKDSDLLYLKG